MLHILTTPEYRNAAWTNEANIVCVTDEDVSSVHVEQTDIVCISKTRADWRKELVHFHDDVHVPCILLTEAYQLDEMAEAINLGANGYLHLFVGRELLDLACRCIESGGIWIPGDLVATIAGQLSKSLHGEGRVDLQGFGLTEREDEVATLVFQGMTNKGISEQLDITERTVKHHVAEILKKCDAKDRLHLILKCSRLG
ncbi:response regulator transcription factor [Aestuariibacter sp. AA17]|uniref:Response regulator transcription factor n=1 Tax=Fluctibacter corallii TaxID=2984329 RepID=A0ABT3A775_9ALTE|nr:response regulator transcription factor [Aestuariibacter sp. AA17]MCV2884535.1 response regulator transcription factor [Aestuariibacter sp. AA17]